MPSEFPRTCGPEITRRPRAKAITEGVYFCYCMLIRILDAEPVDVFAIPSWNVALVTWGRFHEKAASTEVCACDLTATKAQVEGTTTRLPGGWLGSKYGTR